MFNTGIDGKLQVCKCFIWWKLVCMIVWRLCHEWVDVKHDPHEKQMNWNLNSVLSNLQGSDWSQSSA